jgi:hypothetical protein
MNRCIWSGKVALKPLLLPSIGNHQALFVSFGVFRFPRRTFRCVLLELEQL